jgi:hypothetical protein
MSDDKEKAVSIGALWEKNSSKGLKFFSGQIEVNEEKIQIVVFKNDYKKEDKHPDWKIFISKPKDSDQQEGQKQRQLPAHQEENATAPGNEEDDLPF